MVTGFVDDLGAVISDACLAVAPVRVAAGIQNKVLVAMAAGLPVVMTSMISRAIPELHHGENCLIRDDSEEFAEACIRIMADPGFRERLSIQGYNTVLRYYSWAEKLKDYERLYQCIVNICNCFCCFFGSLSHIKSRCRISNLGDNHAGCNLFSCNCCF